MKDWGVFVVGSVVIIIFIVEVIRKAIHTDDPWTTVGFLIGAWIALWYANETYRLRKLSSQQLEADFQPVLNLYIRDGDDIPSIFRICEGKALKIRNTGRGAALNLKVEMKSKDGKSIVVKWLEQTMIAPEGDEIHIQLLELPEKCDDLNGSKLTISAESINKITYIYTYTLEKFSDRIIKFDG